MPAWTVFLFFAVAMLASIVAVGFGVWVMISSRPSSPAEEINVQVPQWGIKVVARMSGGALLVLAGLFSAYKLTVEYPKAWIAVAIVLAGAGGGAGAKKQKNRSGKKNAAEAPTATEEGASKETGATHLEAVSQPL